MSVGDVDDENDENDEYDAIWCNISIGFDRTWVWRVSQTLQNP